MPNNKTENFIRLHLLNNEAVEVLRATFLKLIKQTYCGDVDQFLKEFEDDIKTIHRLGISQRKILFPDNGCTNVDEWDVSLLSFILINCCSLDGKMCLSKLRDLMTKQCSAFTDITEFLEKNKRRIDQMRKEDELVDTQYNKLYPMNPSNKSILIDWDLHLLLSMLVVFSSGQNKEKLYYMLRICVERDVRLHCKNPNLRDYLFRKQSECNGLLRNGKISQNEYNQLFPKDGVFSDINNWDRHLIEVFVANVCVGLSNETLNAVNVVRQIRNKMIAHKGSAEMENNVFLDTWYKLKFAIETIIKQEVPSVMQEWTKKHDELHLGPFDITGAIHVLKEYYLKETSEFNAIKDSLKEIDYKIEAENKQRVANDQLGQQERDELTKINKEIAKNVQYLVDKDKSKDMYTEPIDAECIYIEIHVSSRNESTNERTERVILSAIQDRLKGKQTEVKIQTVLKLVEGMTRDGTEIKDAQSGSVLIKVKCISLKGITNLLVLTESEELRKEMELELKTIFGKEIRLELGITDESKNIMINNLEQLTIEHETKKPLVVRYIDSNLFEQATEDMPYNFIDSGSDKVERSTISQKGTKAMSYMDSGVDTWSDPSQSLQSETSFTAARKVTGDMPLKGSGLEIWNDPPCLPPSQCFRTGTSMSAALTETGAMSYIDSGFDTWNDPPSLSLQSEASITTARKVPKVEKIKTFSIKCPEDKYNCSINSCTVLPTGNIVVCDSENSKVKLFDKHYTYRSVVKLPYNPCDSCLSGEDNTYVLVTVPNRGTIYRIKVGDDMEVKDEIGVGNRCYGITCCMVGIAVAMGGDNIGYIQLLQYDGRYIRRVDTSIQLNYTSYVTSIMNGRQLVVADYDSSRVLSLDVDTGKTVFEYKDDDLRDPTSVASDSHDNIYVVGCESNNVHMLSSTGEKVGDILTHDDGINYPRGLEYNRYNDNIILQPDLYTSEMCVYKIIN